MAYPRKLLTQGEEVVREFRPHWRLLVIPVVWTLVAIALLVVTWRVWPDVALADWLTTLVIVLALIPLAVTPFLRWLSTIYVLTNERLITRTGILSRRGIEIPLESINNVHFNQNILERVLKSGDLLIESAGETGQSRFADIPDPEDFQSILYRTREARAHVMSGPATTQNPSDQPAPSAGPEERLAKLASLHADGVISDAEYAEKRQKLLDEI